MRVLLVDGDHREGDIVASQLDERGHDVVRCFGPDDDHLCRGVALRQECPVDSGSVDVALLVRSESGPPLLREMGAVCALRHRIPVVEAHAHGDAPFTGWVTPTGAGVVEAVEEVAADDLLGHAAAVEIVLGDVPAVVRMGSLPGVTVRRETGRLLLTLTVPSTMDDLDRNSVVTWAVRALREYDPYEPVCDVVLVESV
jgi:hypothetical protein